MNGNDNYFQAKSKAGYDSDTDLPLEVQQKLQTLQQSALGNSNIMGAMQSNKQAEQLRQQAWKDQGMFDNLKSFLKGAWYGDIRNK